MSRLCSVCSHPQRRQIDADLFLHAATYRGIARRFGLQDDALIRHEHRHLTMSWQQSKALQAMLSADNLLDKLSELDEQTRAMLAQARSAGDLRTALAAVRESRENVVQFARLGVLSDLESRVAALEQPNDDDSPRAE